MSEANIAAVRSVGEALSKRDWEAMEELIAEDVEWVVVPSGVTVKGRHELISMYQKFTSAFPDFHVESVTLIGQGDFVANEWSARGTHEGPLERPEGTYPPTGRSFARTGVGIVELRDDKIVRYRDYFDRLTMMEQLGLWAAPAPAPASPR